MQDQLAVVVAVLVSASASLFPGVPAANWLALS